MRRLTDNFGVVRYRSAILKGTFGILVVLVVAAFLFFYVRNLKTLLKKSYYIEEAQLYEVDTFHLFTRAYESADKHNAKFLRFQSINGYYFTIADKVFLAVNNLKKLEDTLMYHDTKFTVFSDKRSYENYKRSKKPALVKVYQIQIGDTKYVDISKVNHSNKVGRLIRVIGPPVFILCFGLPLYRIATSSNELHPKTIIIWLLFASLVVAVTALLTLYFA